MKRGRRGKKRRKEKKKRVAVAKLKGGRGRVVGEGMVLLRLNLSFAGYQTENGQRRSDS